MGPWCRGTSPRPPCHLLPMAPGMGEEQSPAGLGGSRGTILLLEPQPCSCLRHLGAVPAGSFALGSRPLGGLQAGDVTEGCRPVT